MQTWLITGASGFLGTNLGWYLGCRSDASVRRIGVSRSAPSKGLFDAHVALDLAADPASIHQVIEEIKPDVVVNAAAFANHQGCEADAALAFRMNCDAARQVAEACSATGARLMHISTDAVFDGATGGYTEAAATNPFGVYGGTKLAGELAVADACPTAVIARTNFFGWSPTGTRSILEFFVNNLQAGESVRGFTDFVVTSLYAQHVAALLVAASRSDHSGILHIASRDAVSKYDFGVAVATAFGLDPALIEPTVGSTGPDGLSRTRDLSLDTNLFTRIVGYAPPSQADGIRAASGDEALRSSVRQDD